MPDDPVDEILRGIAAPELRPFAFRQEGRTFVYGAANGDQAGVHVQPFQPRGSRVGFGVSYGIAPPVLAGWFSRETDPAAVPKKRYDLWRDGLPAPGRSPWDDPPRDAEGNLELHDEWAFDASNRADVERCGRRLAEALADIVLPRLMTLLDRTALLAAVRDPGQHARVNPHPTLAELILLADDGPSATLDAGLTLIEAGGDPIGFARWARGWSRARSAAPHAGE